MTISILNSLLAQQIEVKKAYAQAPIVAQVESIVVIPPLLKEIGRCESDNKQFKPDGSVKRGIVNPKDVGKYQINEYYHLKDSQKMGINIYTEEGNTEYAMYLFKTQGSRPWLASKPCWSPSKEG